MRERRIASLSDIAVNKPKRFYWGDIEAWGGAGIWIAPFDAIDFALYINIITEFYDAQGKNNLEKATRSVIGFMSKFLYTSEDGDEKLIKSPADYIHFETVDNFQVLLDLGYVNKLAADGKNIQTIKDIQFAASKLSTKQEESEKLDIIITMVKDMFPNNKEIDEKIIENPLLYKGIEMLVERVEKIDERYASLEKERQESIFKLSDDIDEGAKEMIEQISIDKSKES